ncbi:MAG: hypothetical protein HYX93_05430 [Chloroflexi bacterium]|nr:hypothetical protein [Chloroflexota bacterium]
MDYNAGAAVGAGIVGAVAMAAVLYMGIAMMPRQMTMNLLYMLGTMMTRATVPAYVAGAMMHAVMGIVFALVHTGLYQALDLESGLAGWGILFGFVHWIVAGMGIGMVGAMHPLMRSGEMQAPGPFVKNYPPMTAMGFFMLHLLFGLLVGVLYQAWA